MTFEILYMRKGCPDVWYCNTTSEMLGIMRFLEAKGATEMLVRVYATRRVILDKREKGTVYDNEVRLRNYHSRRRNDDTGRESEDGDKEDTQGL